MVTCQGCGTENKPGAAFCSTCARRLDTASQESVVRIRQEHSASGLRWSSVIMVLVLILIVAIVLGFVLANAL